MSTPAPPGVAIPGVAEPLCAHELWQGVVLILIVLYMFVGLSIVCDRYLVRSMEMLVKKLGIADDVAGASFLALGNAMPETTINCLALAKGSASLGLSTIAGSGMWAYTMIPGLCALFSPKGMALAGPSVIRDVAVYCLSLTLLIFFLLDGQIVLWESSTLVVLYAVYIGSLFLLWPIYFPVAGKGERQKLKDGQVGTYGSAAPEDDHTQHNGFDEEIFSPKNEDLSLIDAGPSLYERVMTVIGYPFVLLFRFTIPDCSEGEGKENWFPITFLLSAAYVAGLSFIVVSCTQMISCSLDVSHELLGVTLVAMGAEVPDTFSSVAVAKYGYGGMAFSAAIGSQVTNLLFGIGLPYTIANLNDVAVHLNNAHLYVLVFTLVAVVLCFIAVAAVARVGHNQAILTHFSGALLLGVYGCAVAFAATEVADIL